LIFILCNLRKIKVRVTDMPEQEKNLEQVKAIREAFSQALGLTLTDEIVTEVIEGKPFSLDRLTENHSLTEIGTALISLDAISKNSASGCPPECTACIGDFCIRINTPKLE
jgi:hypothetical protein